MAQHRLPRAGHEQGCLLPVHHQEGEFTHVNGRDSVGQLGSVLISPNGGVPGKQRFQIQTAVFVEAKKIDSITLYQLCARVMGGD